MSYIEAVEDKIPRGKYNGTTCYYPPCHICGGKAFSLNYIRGNKYTCKECKKAKSKTKEQKMLHSLLENAEKAEKAGIDRFEDWQKMSGKAEKIRNREKW